MADRITANNWRNCQTKQLSVDATVRKVTLGPGRYLLMGDAAQIVRFALRKVTDATGTTLDPNEAAAPSSLPLPTAGTVAAGEAWHAADAVVGAAEVQADLGAHRQIDVPESQYFNLYLSANAAATPKLLGPIHWNLTANNSENR